MPDLRMIAAALCALSLSACIDSAAPILTEAQPLLGPTFNLQSFSLRKGVAHDPEQAGYVWNGAHYAHASGGMADIKARATAARPADKGALVLRLPDDAAK